MRDGRCVVLEAKITYLKDPVATKKGGADDPPATTSPVGEEFTFPYELEQDKDVWTSQAVNVYLELGEIALQKATAESEFGKDDPRTHRLANHLFGMYLIQPSAAPGFGATKKKMDELHKKTVRAVGMHVRSDMIGRYDAARYERFLLNEMNLLDWTVSTETEDLDEGPMSKYRVGDGKKHA